MINFWELPENRNRVLFKEKFKFRLVNLLKKKKNTYRLRYKILKTRINIKYIKFLSKELQISLKTFQDNISWIGASNSRGLSDPKLPFNLNTRPGSRFIAAIINDGCLTKEREDSYGRLMYDNFDCDLRDSVMKDYLSIFGGRSHEVSFRNYERKKFFEFPSVIRDLIFLIIKNKGSKSESNLKIPSLIFNNNEKTRRKS